MSVQVQSLIFMFLGAVIFGVSLLADMIGIGGNVTVIGWKQFAGANAGIMFVLFGAHLAYHHVIRKQR